MVFEMEDRRPSFSSPSLLKKVCFYSTTVPINLCFSLTRLYLSQFSCMSCHNLVEVLEVVVILFPPPHSLAGLMHSLTFLVEADR